MRNLKRLAVASLTAIAAACSSAPVAADPAITQALCKGTAKLVYLVVTARNAGATDSLEESSAELLKMLTEAAAPEQAVQAYSKAMQFAYAAPVGTDAQRHAYYQYIGCLATPI